MFRSQFRTEQTPGVSTTEQVKLGIEHIDRLRKAGMETREERLKRITGFWLPALALVVTAIATLGGFYINSQSLENSRQSARQTAGLTAADAEIRLWDLASRERGDAYESSLDAMQLAFDAAGHGDDAEMQKQLTRIRVNLFRLEPLIEKSDWREPLWGDYKKFGELCSERLVASRQVSAPDPAEALKKFDNLRNGMHERLYHLLFDKGPNEFDPLKPLRDVFQ
ncbi:MAG: hypothetical protein M3Z96_00365 [Pseudomonadota bacterium]|nr:hypothetical protein [Pseudomonadota bacterium]